MRRFRFEYIPYGVSIPDRDTITRPANASKPFRVIYAGRMVEEQKRTSEVARSLCRVSTGQLPDVEGLMYGNGPAAKNVAEIIAAEGVGLPVKVGRVLRPGVKAYEEMAQVTCLCCCCRITRGCR